uniref:U1-type domain-containing protein n=1 Tax=Attheya septentrionalis TaxID=420275 RepID=A0A7S2UJC7_9STRA|mmetsp:Transcript_24788/g.44894  ORF Transcript_24788/g.44894 Transcript_24788/m.44894 type:complete len:256 (+) Transcript_24788:203-970(+)|eukprot:CAMPEP_0198292596 /NCGR_PEP_ID=MMETSP1449-20131203/12922_1 /TAXON_ID=420275 /ORGANISM="Attheya septentrionalis, Strain CCMP2084" /LENGTH=255 /DNA_ID=CAMNT_0043991787 /DNA_START=88 /DNA_END=855 /DNA_ORIENTATION=-
MSGKGSALPYKQAANVERRTWDKEAFEARARSRATADQEGLPLRQEKDTGTKTDEEDPEEFRAAPQGRAGPALSQRAFLKARSSKVDGLDSKVGSVELVGADAPTRTKSITDGVSQSSTGVGWHCRVCDCYLKDSLTYLDHINGRKHQRALGYSMRVEQSTATEVTSVLSQLAQTKEATANKIQTKNHDDNDDDEFERAVRTKDELALQRKAERARKREERRKKELEEKEADEEDDTDGVDPALAAMMGFKSFGA